MARLAEGAAPLAVAAREAATRNWPAGPPRGRARRSLKPIDISLSQSPLTDASRSRGFLPTRRIEGQYNTAFQGLPAVGRRPTSRYRVGERVQHIPLLHDNGVVKLCQKRAGWLGVLGARFWVLGEGPHPSPLPRRERGGFTTEGAEGTEWGDFFGKWDILWDIFGHFRCYRKVVGVGVAWEWGRVFSKSVAFCRILLHFPFYCKVERWGDPFRRMAAHV